jgi:hypothetical protein
MGCVVHLLDDAENNKKHRTNNERVVVDESKPFPPQVKTGIASLPPGAVLAFAERV